MQPCLMAQSIPKYDAPPVKYHQQGAEKETARGSCHILQSKFVSYLSHVFDFLASALRSRSKRSNACW